MRKFFSYLSIFSVSLLFFEIAKANEYDFYSFDADHDNDIHLIYGVQNGVKTLLNSLVSLKEE